MTPKKNGSEQNLNEDRDLSGRSDLSANRINDEDNLDTREISNKVEEGDEDYDDEQLEDDELSEEDFKDEEEEM